MTGGRRRDRDPAEQNPSAARPEHAAPFTRDGPPRRVEAPYGLFGTPGRPMGRAAALERPRGSEEKQTRGVGPPNRMGPAANRVVGGPVPVTRDVELDAVRDLLARPPRASVTFLDGGGVAIVPVRARFAGDRLAVGLPADGPDLAGREVVVLIDDGPWWFRLRGASFRGVARREAEAEGLVWWTVEPRRVLAWDYGAIREA